MAETARVSAFVLPQMKASSTNKCSLNECEEFRWWLERMRMVGIDFESIHYVSVPCGVLVEEAYEDGTRLRTFRRSSKIFTTT